MIRAGFVVSCVSSIWNGSPPTKSLRCEMCPLGTHFCFDDAPPREAAASSAGAGAGVSRAAATRNGSRSSASAPPSREGALVVVFLGVFIESVVSL